jgi:hypothetical protein
MIEEEFWPRWDRRRGRAGTGSGARGDVGRGLMSVSWEVVTSDPYYQAGTICRHAAIT